MELKLLSINEKSAYPTPSIV